MVGCRASKGPIGPASIAAHHSCWEIGILTESESEGGGELITAQHPGAEATLWGERLRLAEARNKNRVHTITKTMPRVSNYTSSAPRDD